MKLAIGCLAEWAGFTQDDKLCIIGIFEGMAFIGADRRALIELVPCTLVLRFDAENGEVGQHTLDLRLVDADRRTVFEATPMALVVRAKRPDAALTSSIIVPLRGLQVPGVGDYEFVVSVDGREVGTIPLRVEEARNADAPAP